MLLQRSKINPIIFTPGVNMVGGADVTVAHIYYRGLPKVSEVPERLCPVQRDPLSYGRKWNVKRLHRVAYAALVARLERSHYRLSKSVFAVSPAEAETMAAHGIRIEGVAPNGVDAALFRSRTRSSTDRIRVLTVGSEIDVKGLDLVIDAIAGSDFAADAELQIVTRRKNHSILAEFADRVGIRLTLTEPGQPAESLYGAADIYVAASRSDSFNMPALEAMASGIPVVLSTACGLAAWISDQALVVDPNASDIRDALSVLVRSVQLRRSLGEAGARLASTMTWDVTTAAIAPALLRLDVS